MTTMATEASAVNEAVSAPAAPVALPAWRRALAFGTGFGVAIGDENLDLAIVRARPSGPRRPALATIRNFRSRPASEWGAEISRFIAAAGASGLAATVLLPRSEVIVRVLNLPGVADKDVPNAIDLQVDTLHPWGDVDVVSGWSRVSNSAVLIGLARKELLDSYQTLFTEAGVSLAALTFSPAVLHAALRIWSPATASLVCYQTDSKGRTEVYGESESRPVFSAEFLFPKERALALARAELRLPADYPAQMLATILPGNVAGEDSSLAYAASLAASAPRVVEFANLLPVGKRASHDRIQYVVPAFLAGLLVIALLVVFVILPALEKKGFRDELTKAARQLEPAALRAQAIDKKLADERTRIVMLDDLKRRPQADLDVLNELTRLLPPPVWTGSVEIYPDSVIIAGQADQAAPLLKILDSSPLFEKSEFTLSVTRNDQGEQFRIKTMRRGRAGRSTP
jgi:Tfp pilus assembly protein PilN